MINSLNINQPESGTATKEEDAVKVAERIGYHVLVIPSYVFFGRSITIVYKEKYLRKYLQETIEVSADRPVLIDRYLDNAIEVDVDCISDGKDSVIAWVVHSGDSVFMIPTMTLSKEVLVIHFEYGKSVECLMAD